MGPKRVLTFGTFDILHPGHEFYLKEAKKHGDKLFVVVARDSTVKKLKGRLPFNSEGKRLSVIEALDYVEHGVLGSEGCKHGVVKALRPDVICFGYDQESFNGGLKEFLDEVGHDCEIVRIKHALEPDRFKSSLLRPDEN